MDDATKPILKDPVCGMTVTEQSSHVFKYKDKPVYFCSAGCKTKFAADPSKYLADDSKFMKMMYSYLSKKRGEDCFLETSTFDCKKSLDSSREPFFLGSACKKSLDLWTISRLVSTPLLPLFGCAAVDKSMITTC